jgi:hypothetical protein
MPSIVTVAQLKLAKLVNETSAAAVGRQVGSTGNTVRLLASGAATPKATTVLRMRTVGILPLDWFTVAPTEAEDKDDLSGRPIANTGA